MIRKKGDILYLKTGHIYSSTEGLLTDRLNAAVEQSNLSQLAQLPAKVLTQQFYSVLPVNSHDLPNRSTIAIYRISAV